jgi:hypothetical protein
MVKFILVLTAFLEKLSFDNKKTVLGIRIRRISIFLDLPDPDPIVRSMDPDPAPNVSLSHKGVEQTNIMLAN